MAKKTRKKLPEKVWLEIRDKRARGASVAQLSAQYGVSAPSISSKLHRMKKENVGAVAYQLPEYMQIGDEVVIVDALNSEDIGKRGTLGSVNPIGVDVSENGFVFRYSATKIKKYKEAPVEALSKAPRIPRTLVRFICEFAMENDHMRYPEIAELFQVKPTQMYNWMSKFKKDNNSYPKYSPNQARVWTQKYLSQEEGEEAAAPEAPAVEDLIEAEELSRKLRFTDGESIYDVGLIFKEGRITLRSESDPVVNLSLTIEQAESFHRSLEGSLKSYRSLSKEKS